ncbi:MAG: Nif3-like dinuclear metal center hexameric protein [Bacteroidota bacterium]
MTIKDFIRNIEKEIPSEIAWNKDNVGLQVGDLNDKIKNIICSLDLNLAVIEEAIKAKANLIVTHHPLIFNEQKNIIANERIGNLLHKLISNKINLFCAHTNFDSISDGVSFSLAKKLNLENIKFLSSSGDTLCKIIVYVPKNKLEEVAEAMFNAGAGSFTNYEKCSFRTDGIGTFLPKENANPAIGEIGKLEKVNESKLEMICSKWKLDSIIDAMKNAHPYEEIAYDVFEMKNKSTMFGIGAIGNLKNKMSQNSFLNYVKDCLKIKSIRYTNGKSKIINTVAVCGGSGSELTSAAIKSGADAFITADVKYHSFQEFENKILLIDAGHYETEVVSLNSLSKIINKILNDKTIKIFITKKSTNPVNYF